MRLWPPAEELIRRYRIAESIDGGGGVEMTAADHYRAKAAALDAMAKLELNALMRSEWTSIAKAYRRLAQLADRNSQTDVVYEPPPPEWLKVQQQQQQQQKQVQPKKEE